MKTIKCDLCDVSCESGGSYLDHLETHVGITLKCRLCQKSFRNKYLFLYHKETSGCELRKAVSEHQNSCQISSKNKSYTRPKKTNSSSSKQCSQCKMTFQWQRHFIKHMEGHKRNNCQHCSALFTNRRDLRVHMVQEHQLTVPEADYKCQFCDKKFSKRRVLFRHVKEHANGQWVCDSCGGFFQAEEELMIHKEREHQRRQWACELCHETFIRRQQFLLHIKAHDRHACGECGERFAAKRRLLAHRASEHSGAGAAEQSHQCADCGQRFSRPLRLRLHARIHSGERPHACAACSKHYHTARGLAQHEASSAHRRRVASRGEGVGEQEKVKRVACPDCGARFASKHRLQRHVLRLHQPQALLPCSRCPRAFNCRENLKRHEATHSAERRFVCERCAAAFRALHALKDHMAYVHSAARDFACTVCGAAFKRNSGLTRHMATHSEARPHACSACGLSYKRLSHLRRHRQAAHAAPAPTRAPPTPPPTPTESIRTLPAEAQLVLTTVDLDQSHTVLTLTFDPLLGDALPLPLDCMADALFADGGPAPHAPHAPHAETLASVLSMSVSECEALLAPPQSQPQPPPQPSSSASAPARRGGSECAVGAMHTMPDYLPSFSFLSREQASRR